MSEDRFLKVMFFGSPFKKKIMQRPLLGYALVGYSLGYWGYMSYRVVRDYFELERQEEERFQEVNRRHEARVAEIMADMRARAAADDKAWNDMMARNSASINKMSERLAAELRDRLS